MYYRTYLQILMNAQTALHCVNKYAVTPLEATFVLAMLDMLWIMTWERALVRPKMFQIIFFKICLYLIQISMNVSSTMAAVCSIVLTRLEATFATALWVLLYQLMVDLVMVSIEAIVTAYHTTKKWLIIHFNNVTFFKTTGNSVIYINAKHLYISFELSTHVPTHLWLSSYMLSILSWFSHAITTPDIDECAIANGGCLQGCGNTIGAYMCSCNAGYRLAADNMTCVGKINRSLQFLKL